MTKQRIGKSIARKGLLMGGLIMAVCACTRETDDGTGVGTPAPAATGRGGAASEAPISAVASNTGTGVTPGAGSSTSTGATVPPAGGGATSGTNPGTGTTGTTASCTGLPPSLAATDAQSLAAACNGTSVEAEPIPVDMIILMDRSISNSYAIGSDTASPAQPGERTRWQVLTAALQALATNPDAAQIGASITFFSYSGGMNDAQDCEPKNYEKPAVPLGLLGANGGQIVTAMQSITQPSGLTPIVPALTGALTYAMAEKQRDPSREKVVVLISDGFPTQCSTKPDEVAKVIKDGSLASIPIRTFIIGIGSPQKMDSAKFNLLNYARAGNTGRAPFVLDESAGADQVGRDLVNNLLNISNSNMACEYGVHSPDPSMVVDPDRVMFTYQPSVGALQEIPKVTSLAGCANAPHGGWYFDNPSAPTKLTLCPCSCAGLAAGRANVYYGCLPQLVFQ